MTARQRFARRLRFLADRIDHRGAPKCTSMLTFTFEPGRGMVIHTSDRHVELRHHERPGLPGCMLWYLGDDEYEKAHTEAGQT